MSLRSATALALVAALVAAAPAGTQLTTSRFGFSLTNNLSQDLSSVGQGVLEASLELDGVFSLTIAETDSGRMATVVLDTLSGSVDGQLGQVISRQAIESATGMTWTGVIDEKGRLSDLESDSEGALTNQIEGQLLTGLLPYVQQGAEIGSSWVDTVTIERHDDAGDVATTVVATYTAESDTTVNGKAAMKIGSVNNADISMYQEAQMVDINGASEGLGFFLIAADGSYLGGERETNTSLEATVAAAGAIIPIEASAVVKIWALD